MMIIPIEIQCSCGQRFAFQVEPVDGRMPNGVVCTQCGGDLTQASNEQIRQQLATVAPAAPPEKSNLWIIITLCVSVPVLLGLIAGVYFFYDPDAKSSTQQQPQQEAISPDSQAPSVPEEAPVPTNSTAPVSAPTVAATPTDPISSTPAAPVTSTPPDRAAAKSGRDPSYVAIGALFLRNSQTQQIEFTTVLPHSPAEEAGIVVGDILLKIDKKRIGKQQPTKEIADLFFGPVGSTVTMEVLQTATGKTNRLTMVRRKLKR